jgi:chromosome segregation ATPase
MAGKKSLEAQKVWDQLEDLYKKLDQCDRRTMPTHYEALKKELQEKEAEFEELRAAKPPPPRGIIPEPP